jgi:uncharacterized protein (TIGR02271 family)
MSQQTVVGLFNSASEAQQAVQKLMSTGFIESNVDVAAHDAQTAQRMTGGAGSSGGGDAGDGISNFFSNLFGGNDNDDARAYTHVTRSGGSVVTVHAASAEEATRARDILDSCGAMDVHAQAQSQGYGMTGGAQGWAGNNEGQQTGQAIPIIEENLQVGKRTEQTGGAAIRSRIIERPVEEHVRLREEHVNVQRRDVNRPATEADFNAFKEGEISITEQAERAVVAKEARVVGEVTVGKEVTERDQVVRDTVRSTDVEVEQLGANQTRTTGSSTDNDMTNR